MNKDGDVIDRDNTRQEMTSWDLLYNVLRRNFDGAGDDAYFHSKNKNREERDDTGREEGKGEYLYGHLVTSLKG